MITGKACLHGRAFCVFGVIPPVGNFAKIHARGRGGPLGTVRKDLVPPLGLDAGTAGGRGARGGRKLRPLWGVAAAAAVVLGVFFYAEYLRKPYCYIDGVAIYDKEAAMQATVYLQGLSDFGDQVRMVDELIINE